MADFVRGTAARRWFALLLAAYCGLVLVLCLWPFEFHAVTAETLRSGRVELIPFTHVCPVHGPLCPRDALRNVALYVPLGALVALLRPRDAARRAALGAAALSVSVEVTQLFLPSRAPSTADVLTNIAGALVGAALVRLALRGRAVTPSRGSSTATPPRSSSRCSPP